MEIYSNFRYWYEPTKNRGLSETLDIKQLVTKT